mgnify:CR=1 FL=1
MKYRWLFALVFGWYFAYTAPFEEGDGKAMLSAVVGPFDTAFECQGKNQEIAATFERYGIAGVKWTKCHYRVKT